MDLIQTAGSNLLRNKVRTILTVLALVIGAITISLTLGINTGVNRYIETQLNQVGNENILMVQTDSNNKGSSFGSAEPQKYQGENKDAHYLTNEDLMEIKKIKGVQDAFVYPSFYTNYVQGKNKEKYILPLVTTTGLNRDIQAGKGLNDKGKAYEIILAPEYVKSLGFPNDEDAVGQTIILSTPHQIDGEEEKVQVQIVGVLAPSLIQSGQSLANLSLAHKLYDINKEGQPKEIKDQHKGAVVTMKDGLSSEQVKKIQKKIADKGFSSSTFEEQLGSIHTLVSSISMMLMIFAVIALLAAFFGIINTLYMSVHDRTREIGLLKAMGMKNRSIFSLFSYEAVIIGFFGGIIGVVISWGVGILINQVVVNSVFENLEGLKLVMISPSSAVVVVVFIMLFAFIAGIFPARRAAKIHPINALRYE